MIETRIRVSTTTKADKLEVPERRLAWAILSRAVNDLMGDGDPDNDPSGGIPIRLRKRTKKWLLSDRITTLSFMWWVHLATRNTDEARYVVESIREKAYKVTFPDP